MTDGDLTVDFSGTENIDRMIAVEGWDSTAAYSAVESNTKLPAKAHESAGVAGGKTLFTSPDVDLTYVSAAFTLKPGESYEFSYGETLFAAEDDPSFFVNYVDEAGNVLADEAQVFYGRVGTSLTLSDEVLAAPTGYSIAQSFALPQSVAYGRDGVKTIVEVPVVVTPAAADMITVKFDTQGGTPDHRRREACCRQHVEPPRSSLASGRSICWLGARCAGYCCVRSRHGDRVESHALCPVDRYRRWHALHPARGA